MISLAQEDVQQLLEELFQSISHELPGQAVPEATDQTTRLLFKLFDRWGVTTDSALYSLFLYLCMCDLTLLSFREQTGVILLRSVEAALIALCGDALSAKQKGLFYIHLIFIAYSV